jgi:hypothetical protein
MAVRDKNQAAAFLNNGWEIASEDDSQKVESKSTDDFSKHMNPPEEVSEVKYTKTDIYRLSTAELKELATAENISDVENKTGGELKKELVEHFNL